MKWASAFGERVWRKTRFEKKQECFVYFQFFKPQDCVKSSAEGRRPLIQRFRNSDSNRFARAAAANGCGSV